MGINWKWNDSYTTTTTTGEPIEIEATSWKIGDKIEINSPITDSSHTAAAPLKNAMGVEQISYGWICPKCGWRYNDDIHVTLDYKYCPMCGERLVDDGEDD